MLYYYNHYLLYFSHLHLHLFLILSSSILLIDFFHSTISLYTATNSSSISIFRIAGSSNLSNQMTFQPFKIPTYPYPPKFEDLSYIPEQNKTIGFFTKENKIEDDLVFLDYSLSIPLICPFHKNEKIQMQLDAEFFLECPICIKYGREL